MMATDFRAGAQTRKWTPSSVTSAPMDLRRTTRNRAELVPDVWSARGRAAALGNVFGLRSCAAHLDGGLIVRCLAQKSADYKSAVQWFAAVNQATKQPR
ncbi:MAG TPA: hypothetical protein VMU84_08745, partial [Thermoanaerobaculia bacterium]|nr:hypothetical protein [Thermoanaerobaculia bacterium]